MGYLGRQSLYSPADMFSAIDLACLRGFNMKTISEEDRMILLGAIDSLACALADHGHEWTEGEKEIYEQAAALLTANP